ncbi:GATA zinc finger protein [Diplocarpon rosae]|nr:GATA zinc finger protein [Diplocarpon rosae]
MEKSNRLLAEELASLLSSKKKRKRRRGAGHPHRDCANCHTRVTPEWRRGPSGQRDLCNSCGLRWAKQTGRVSPRNSTRGEGSKQSHSSSPAHSSPLQQEVSQKSISNPNLNIGKSTAGNIKGDGAAVPEVLGGRSTIDSMPVHATSQGFREGGQRKITNIDERDEGVT